MSTSGHKATTTSNIQRGRVALLLLSRRIKSYSSNSSHNACHCPSCRRRHRSRITTHPTSVRWNSVSSRVGHMMTFVARAAYLYMPCGPSSAFFFTLLLQSRPNPPPRVNLTSRFSRRVSSGFPLHLPSRKPWVSRLKRGGLSWKASEGFFYMQRACEASIWVWTPHLLRSFFQLSGSFSSNISTLSFASVIISGNPIFDLDQHVQTIFS